MANPIGRIKTMYRTWRHAKNMPLRIEFVVTDWCNLNCRGCTHYSPLVKKEFADTAVLEKAIRHIGETCSDALESVYLIGGETLLYPELPHFMRLTRKYFPNQKINIFTNGIALPKMPDEFWDAARECRIIISLTVYPIKFDYDAVIDLCKQRGLEVDIFGDRSMENSFFRFALDPQKKQNRYISHFKCYNRGCLSVIGDKIYPCSISGCVTHLNKAKGTNFEHKKGDFINVFSVKSARDLKRLRDRAVPFCSYCILPPQTVNYAPSKRDVTEWVETPK